MPDPDKMTATVRSYVDAFHAKDAEAIAALYAEDATVEDPVGGPAIAGRAAIRAFYDNSVQSNARLSLDGDIRVAGDYAAFAFSCRLGADGAQRIDVIETMRFDAHDRIIEMRAFWGPSNMQGF